MQKTRSYKQKEKLQRNIINIFREIREYIDKITFIIDTVYMELKKCTYEEAYKKVSDIKNISIEIETQ